MSAGEVAMDKHKVDAVLNWPQLKTIKALRGFLGLTGYYRRFIQGYGVIARPLHDLLKKDGFYWNQEATLAFQKLQTALTSAPVLALPDFSREFVIETDASSDGIGAVLAQDGKPIAFFSKGLSTKNRALSVYEKELLALVTAVQRWRPYLLGKHFIIKADHHSLKYLLAQRIATPSQQKWLVKLLGYDYSIQYKKGCENLAADALSRKRELVQLCSISGVQSTLIEEVKQSWSQDPHLQKLLQAIQASDPPKPYYQFKAGVLSRKGRIMVGSDIPLRHKLISYFHGSSVGGHLGISATLHRLKQEFYWKKMKPDVYTFIRECDTCQRCRGKM